MLDSGDGLKLERFGRYVFIRPEPQAIWKQALPQADWQRADGVFISSSEESGGHWKFNRSVDERWSMGYNDLKFWGGTTSGRHLGLFPEAAVQWDWAGDLIRNAGRSNEPSGKGHKIEVLNLFGYTGLATLSAAMAGAKVTHVDASRKSVNWARSNQELSGLTAKPIRWIVEDALKYVRREVKRGVLYDGIILEPPKFGRGPKGEVWEVYKSLPALIDACKACLSPRSLFVVMTLYAVRASAIHVAQALSDMTSDLGGTIECGELAMNERSAGRVLSQAVTARWSKKR